jgi:predicted Fe-S protein YdhL (DUF1289 family)
MAEIEGWPAMADSEREAVLARAAGRRAGRAHAVFAE